MDTELQESIDKFRKLTGLAHSCYGSPKHKFNTREEETANQLFLKIYLSLDSIKKILPQANHIQARLNTSSLMILYRALMEEKVIFEYLFDSSLEKEEKELRFDFYYCHGVVEEIKTLEELRTANPEDNDSRETPRKANKEKLEKQKEDYKAKLNKNSNKGKIPKALLDKDGDPKKPTYMQPKELFDQYLKAQNDNSEPLRNNPMYGVYKLASSFTHSSSLSLKHISSPEMNYDKILVKFIRMLAGSSIHLYAEIFNLSIKEDELSDLTYQ